MAHDAIDKLSLELNKDVRKAQQEYSALVRKARVERDRIIAGLYTQFQTSCEPHLAAVPALDAKK
jgi:hypothetical protein